VAVDDATDILPSTAAIHPLICNTSNVNASDAPRDTLALIVVAARRLSARASDSELQFNVKHIQMRSFNDFVLESMRFQ
jgi:hypothetical protein